MVSVSTCGGQSQGPHHPRLPTGARAHGWCPPHGQDPRGRELGRQCCLPSAPPPKGKASCIPQSQRDVSFPASVHITSPYEASTPLAAWRLPPRSEEGAWRYLGGTWGLGLEGVLSPSWLCSGPAGRRSSRGRLHHCLPLRAPSPGWEAPQTQSLGLKAREGPGGMMGRWGGRGEPREARKAERVSRGWRKERETEREGEEGGENRSKNSWKNQKVAGNGKL